MLVCKILQGNMVLPFPHYAGLFILNGIIQVSECLTSLEMLLITAGSSECALVNLRVA